MLTSQVGKCLATFVARALLELYIDECAKRKDNCDHDCINTPGSFRCACKDGYVLQEDGKACESKKLFLNISFSMQSNVFFSD
ncbi:hypothetical protein TNCV_1216021 [Trichonephila clavipes]|nr:hypothetical protein TNCV_1216021 [Trichonephila clavipes]